MQTVILSERVSSKFKDHENVLTHPGVSAMENDNSTVMYLTRGGVFRVTVPNFDLTLSPLLRNDYVKYSKELTIMYGFEMNFLFTPAWLITPIITVIIMETIDDNKWTKYIRERMKPPTDVCLHFLSGLPETFGIYSELKNILSNSSDPLYKPILNHINWNNGIFSPCISFTVVERLKSGIPYFQYLYSINQSFINEKHERKIEEYAKARVLTNKAKEALTYTINKAVKLGSYAGSALYENKVFYNYFISFVGAYYANYITSFMGIPSILSYHDSSTVVAVLWTSYSYVRDVYLTEKLLERKTIEFTNMIDKRRKIINEELKLYEDELENRNNAGGEGKGVIILSDEAMEKSVKSVMKNQDNISGLKNILNKYIFPLYSGQVDVTKITNKTLNSEIKKLKKLSDYYSNIDESVNKHGAQSTINSIASNIDDFTEHGDMLTHFVNYSDWYTVNLQSKEEVRRVNKFEDAVNDVLNVSSIVEKDAVDKALKEYNKAKENFDKANKDAKNTGSQLNDIKNKLNILEDANKNLTKAKSNIILDKVFDRSIKDDIKHINTTFSDVLSNLKVKSDSIDTKIANIDKIDVDKLDVNSQIKYNNNKTKVILDSFSFTSGKVSNSVDAKPDTIGFFGPSKNVDDSVNPKSEKFDDTIYKGITDNVVEYARQNINKGNTKTDLELVDKMLYVRNNFDEKVLKLHNNDNNKIITKAPDGSSLKFFDNSNQQLDIPIHYESTAISELESEYDTKLSSINESNMHMIANIAKYLGSNIQEYKNTIDDLNGKDYNNIKTSVHALRLSRANYLKKEKKTLIENTKISNDRYSLNKDDFSISKRDKYYDEQRKSLFEEKKESKVVEVLNLRKAATALLKEINLTTSKIKYYKNSLPYLKALAAGTAAHTLYSSNVLLILSAISSAEAGLYTLYGIDAIQHQIDIGTLAASFLSPILTEVKNEISLYSYNPFKKKVSYSIFDLLKEVSADLYNNTYNPSWTLNIKEIASVSWFNPSVMITDSPIVFRFDNGNYLKINKYELRHMLNELFETFEGIYCPAEISESGITFDPKVFFFRIPNFIPEVLLINEYGRIILENLKYDEEVYVKIAGESHFVHMQNILGLQGAFSSEGIHKMNAVKEYENEVRKVKVKTCTLVVGKSAIVH